MFARLLRFIARKCFRAEDIYGKNWRVQGPPRQGQSTRPARMNILKSADGLGNKVSSAFVGEQMALMDFGEAWGRIQQ